MCFSQFHDIQSIWINARCNTVGWQIGGQFDWLVWLEFWSESLVTSPYPLRKLSFVLLPDVFQLILMISAFQLLCLSCAHLPIWPPSPCLAGLRSRTTHSHHRQPWTLRNKDAIRKVTQKMFFGHRYVMFGQRRRNAFVFNYRTSVVTAISITVLPTPPQL